MALRALHIIERGEKMSKAIFPGSFDPVTIGHIDVLQRAAKLFDEVIVVILHNGDKQSLFRVEDRLTFLRHATKNIANVRCAYEDGLTVAFAKKEHASAIIRGVRSIKDYEYEMDIATANRHIDDSIETVFFFADPRYSFLSSSLIREWLRCGLDVSDYVTHEVAIALQNT